MNNDNPTSSALAVNTNNNNPPSPSSPILNEVKSEGGGTGTPNTGGDLEEELLLKWDDHHRSFFELAEDLCHQEQFIDVTLSCGEHNFPAHKLILSVCSPYFRHLFLRNPCKHPIVVLKDVHFKYMKLLLMYMYRGEVSCPQEDLAGLLRTARSLQIRGLVELERKREAEGLTNSITGSPIKRPPSDDLRLDCGTSTTSCEVDPDDFSLDDVRSRLHGQLEIQPISQQPSSTFSSSHWMGHDIISKAVATSSSSSMHHNNESEEENERLPHHYQKLRRLEDAYPPPSSMLLGRHKWNNDNGGGGDRGNNGTDLSMHRQQIHNRRASPMMTAAAHSSGGGNGSSSSMGAPRGRSRSTASAASSSSAAASSAAAAHHLLAAAHAAGMPAGSIDQNNPMSSMNALLAAAQQAHHGSSGASSSLPASTLASLLPATSSTSSSPSSSAANSTPPAAPGASTAAGGAAAASSSGAAAGGAAGNNGVDLSQAAAVANLQLYYYMQKVASAGMGNPKERKECPICGKTLYDRSTWNRHMRIHTGEKPYPCRFCGRRFRTNYNKLGHEKKCPDRQLRPLGLTTAAGGGATAVEGATDGAGGGSANNGPSVYR